MIADLSLEETAEVMGKRVGAIKALQRRAVGNLKKVLETERVSP
jgi:RNA polymerase sigma-70 factor (ECF subfamily)